MVDLTKLPLSVTSFESFVAKSKIYVDKTDMIASLAKYDNPLFLSRPRRFGKSTLVSTFHELFANGLEKFQGFKIVNADLWHDKTYKVIHLDFSGIKNDSDATSFLNKLSQLLLSAFSLSDINFTLNKEDPISMFRNAVQVMDNGSLVLLIDEYDAPLTEVMSDKNNFDLRQGILSELFATVKMLSNKFRFIFITGVTRFSNTSIFSAFNNIEDISFDSDYGDVVGYTQEELEFYFNDYLNNAVEVINNDLGEIKYTYESLLDDLKLNYDGYSFDKRCKHHVYNPWSILNFLKKPQDGFEPYWMTTGGAKPTLLINYLDTFVGQNILKNELVDYLNLDFTQVASIEDLSPNITSIVDCNFPLFAVLYQAGYFTIKNTGTNYLEVGLPNLEVKKAFAEIILNKLTSKSAAQISAFYGGRIKTALNDHDFLSLKDEFNKILNEFSYESVSAFKEYAFRDIYKVILQIIGFNTYTEYQTALGRSDLCFEDDKNLYICEFKVIKKIDKVQSKIDEAKSQIREKKYSLRISDKKVTALVVIIINENKSKTNTAFREVAAVEAV